MQKHLRKGEIFSPEKRLDQVSGLLGLLERVASERPGFGIPGWFADLDKIGSIRRDFDFWWKILTPADDLVDLNLPGQSVFIFPYAGKLPGQLERHQFCNLMVRREGSFSKYSVIKGRGQHGPNRGI